MPKFLLVVVRRVVAAWWLTCVAASACSQGGAAISGGAAVGGGADAGGAYASGTSARRPAAGDASMVAALSHLPAPPRAFPARLSAGQAYRPCAAGDAEPLGTDAGCAASAGPPPAPPGLAPVVAAASARARARVDPDALHALALADLAWSDTAGNSLDRSISTLRTVARLSARPAPALADLAAALLVRAERRREARDLFEAADVTLLALESDSALAPARFNLALALGRIGLVDETARAWAAFLAVEPRGPWADEAHRRAAAVARAASPPRFDPAAADLAGEAARAPQETRLYGWNEALGRWGAATLAHDSAGAARALAWARVAGGALEARGGDATLADAVRVIDRAAPNRARTRTLAAGHRAFAAASANYDATRYEHAGRGFAMAAGAPGPLGLWARAFVGATQSYAGSRGHAERTLRGVLARTDVQRYPASVGRARWMLGSTLSLGGRTEAALGEYRRAATAFARAGEPEHLGAVQATAAYTVYALGDSRATADAIREALRTLRGYCAASWRYNALYAATLAAERDGFVRTASRTQSEAVMVAARGGRPMLLAEARIVRARLAARGGPAVRQGAGADLAAAQRALAMVPASLAREWVQAELHVTEAALLPDDAAVRTITALDTAVAYFARPVTPDRLVPALVARADARLRAGDSRRAAEDLDQAVAIMAAGQGLTKSLAFRASLLALARGVVDRSVALSIARGEQREALERLEGGRVVAGLTRGFPDQRALRGPPGTVVLVYALVGDSLLTWTVEGTVVRLVPVTVRRTELIGAAERARAALELHAAGAANAELARLYDWLVRPVRARLGPGGAALVVVADDALAAVPFAALLDRASGRYLVEDYEVRFAPSVRAVAAAPTQVSAPGPVLVVADPALGPSAPPGLRPLPEARAEARGVAAFYRASRTLSGEGATIPAVLEALSPARVLHYAGHAVFDDERPSRSMLVLSPTAAGLATAGDATGMLTAGRIASLDLRRTRLVVLSACETVRAPSGRGGGFAGLAGAFLTAGAGGVVGAAWRVDDAATRALMDAFHRAYARVPDAARALRTAQLSLLRSHDPALRAPAAWAGFRYLGG